MRFTNVAHASTSKRRGPCGGSPIHSDKREFSKSIMKQSPILWLLRQGLRGACSRNASTVCAAASGRRKTKARGLRERQRLAIAKIERLKGSKSTVCFSLSPVQNSLDPNAAVNPTCLRPTLNLFLSVASIACDIDGWPSLHALSRLRVLFQRALKGGSILDTSCAFSHMSWLPVQFQSETSTPTAARRCQAGSFASSCSCPKDKETASNF